MRIAFFAAVLLIIFGASCSPSGTKKVTVSGEVTFDGKLIETGDILFMAADGHASPEGGRIVNGRYECLCVPGRKRVEIRATREIPGTSDSMRNGRPSLEDYIPRQFNVDTTLNAEVPIRGTKQLDFSLIGPPGKK